LALLTPALSFSLDKWSLTTSANISAGVDGAIISSASFAPAGWLPVSAPCTVLACLMQQGQYADIFVGGNIYEVDTLQFNVSWWYRTQFTVPAATPGSDARTILRLKGIGYRANVWLNGLAVADNSTIVGTFRYFELDITSFLVAPTRGSAAEAANTLAVEVFRQYDRSLPSTNHDVDLGITFVDWNPPPPDSSMGLWREVEVVMLGGPLSVDYPALTVALPPTAGTQFTAPSVPRVGSLDAASIAPGARIVATTDPVTTPSDPASCNVTLLATVRKWNSSGGVAGVLGVRIADADGAVVAAFAQPLTLAAGQELLLQVGPDSQPALRLASPRLWWPAQMLPGRAHQYTLSLQLNVTGPGSAAASAASVAATGAAGVPSDASATLVGLRDMQSHLDANGHRLFTVNGVPILIRGGGWSPDLFLRPDPARLAVELAYTQAMGLNAIRLEGKMEPDAFFDACDAAGLLTLPGWCCCDAWQHWSLWGGEQVRVSGESMRSQARRLRSHASVAAFLISSDELPPADVETEYRGVLEAEGWTDFSTVVAAAAAGVSKVSGSTGVKMSGPYSWVPPAYWLLDQGQHNLGGAWGFLTEGGPGEAPLTQPSLEAVVPAGQLWPPAPDSCWGHCGDEEGMFGNLDRFNGPLAARYGGAAADLEGYLLLGQVAAYEGHRAMWEGYSRNKYAASTGLVQWMLNSAWPSNIWHLFEWDLTPAATYFATQKPCASPLHVLYSYDDASVWLLNNAYAPAAVVGGAAAQASALATDSDSAVPAGWQLVVGAQLLSLNGSVLFAASQPLTQAAAADSAAQVLSLPTQQQLLGVLGAGATYFVRLQLLNQSTAASSIDVDLAAAANEAGNWAAPSDKYAAEQAAASRKRSSSAAGAGSQDFIAASATASAPGQLVTENAYWLSTAEDVLEWGQSTFYNTPCSAYANFSALHRLPPVQLNVTASTDFGANVTTVTVTNPATNTGVAFFTRVRLLTPAAVAAASDADGSASTAVADESRAQWRADVATLRGARGAGGGSRFETQPGTKAAGAGIDVAPIFWSDNYLVLLLPGDSRTLVASYDTGALQGQQPQVAIDSWNGFLASGGAAT
jgi:exo-1,4-beta-D-glucosaminidase